MNMKRIFMSVILTMFTSTSLAAMDWGIELGARQQAGDVAGLNFSANSMIGFQGGVFAHVPTEQGPVHFRTGILYTQRPLQSESDITGDTIDYSLDYLDIPVDILIKSGEKFGVYMGFHISINVNKSCSGNDACRVNDVDTPLFPVVFGMMFKATPKFGFNFYIDGINGPMAKGLYDYKAVGLNLTYSMD
ncbi:outer membrane beta-barrel protein [Bdellovibrio bacteriovorus]|uniref:outer membrane beta-barrel protein n=1 Tax=Bdellovibrio bacteriovorus TaxID=959 RepID=UPI0035A5D82A